MKALGGIWWMISIAMAWIQGGFLWITFNIFFPIAPAFKIAEILMRQ